MSLTLGFAELLGGGLLLTSAVTGHPITDVMAGRTTPLRGLTDGGQASPTGPPDTGSGGLGDALGGTLGDLARAAGRGVTMSPNADRPGVPTDPIVRAFVYAMSVIVGRTLNIGTGSNHTRLTDSGNVSDHWSGHGADIPVGLAGQPSGDAVATAALMIVGVRDPGRVARAGGIHNITPTAGPWKGHRIQIIWKAPGHYDHVHVGIE